MIAGLVGAALATEPADPVEYELVCPTGDGFERCCATAPGHTCHPSIGEAIAAAPRGGTVVIGSGNYTRPLTIRKNVRLVGQAGTAAPVLSTAYAKARGVILVEDGARVVLERLVLASSVTRALEARRGAHVTLRDSELLVSGSRDFGAVVRVADSTFAMSGTLVDGGTAAIHGGQLFAKDADVTVRTSTFVGGTALDAGGAVYAEGSSTLAIDRCTFAFALSYLDGGAIHLAEGSQAVVTRSEFQNNRAFRDGAAIAVGPRASVEIADTSFLGNDAERSGGAIASRACGVDLRRVELLLNRSLAPDGGGGAIAYSCGDPGAVTTWRNLRVVENLSSGQGGAAWVSTTGTLELVQSTLLGNFANEGGGVAVRRDSTGAVLLEADLVAFTGAGAAVYDPAGRARSETSVWFDNTGGHWIPSGSPPEGDGNVYGRDPQLFAYSRNRSAFDDDFGYHPLQSPLVGAGGEGVDLDGSPRDVGAAGGPEAEPATWADADGDGWPAVHDCNDADPDAHPHAPEVLDGVDHDCDGADGVDLDRDGFSPSGRRRVFDCDDTDPRRFPGAEEDNRLGRDHDLDCDGYPGQTRGVKPLGCDHAGGDGFLVGLLLALTARRRSASCRGTG